MKPASFSLGNASKKRANGEVRVGHVSAFEGDALKHYASWNAPTCIISDGPYGLGKFPGEPLSDDRLAEWYAPHIAAWSEYARPDTTLWFWNTEIGWAKVHAVLELHGWQYEEACIWDKGLSHVAGNCNGKTIRGMPVVTELAVRYTRRATLPDINGTPLALKDWVRSEWMRSGLPMYKANKACGVVNAATRKYLTKCHLWYFPPPEALVRMAAYCQKHGQPAERPYFSIDGMKPPSMEEWKAMRAKWNHVHGLTNVWSEPPVHGSERLKAAGTSRYLHANQKPLMLVERQIRSCTDEGDVIWEPFGGLFSASVAAAKSGRRSFAAEINRDFFVAGSKRLQSEVTTHFVKARNAA